MTTSTESEFAFGANKPSTDVNISLFDATITHPQSGLEAFSAPKFGDENDTTPTFGGISSSVTTTCTNISGSSQTAAPVFGSSNISSTQPKTENVFVSTTSQTTTAPFFGSQIQANALDEAAMNAPTFESSTSSSNIFGSTLNTQSQLAFGASNNLFSTPTTADNQISNSAFGSSAAGVFAFGQTSSHPPATTESTGNFGNSSTSTATNSAFVVEPTTPSQIIATAVAKTTTTPTGLIASTSDSKFLFESAANNSKPGNFQFENLIIFSLLIPYHFQNCVQCNLNSSARWLSKSWSIRLKYTRRQLLG